MYRNFIILTKKYFMSYKVYLFQFLFISLQVTKLSLPFILMYIIDEIIVNQHFFYLNQAIVFYLVILLVQSLFSYYINRYFLSYLYNKVLTFRTDLVLACINSDASFYENESTGDMVYRTTSDITSILNGWIFIFGSLLINVISIICMMYLIGFKSYLTILTIVTLILNMICLSFFIKKIEPTIKAVKTRSQDFNKTIYDIVSKIETIKVFKLADQMKDRVQNSHRTVNNTNLDYFLKEKVFEIIITLINSIWTVLVLVIGSKMIQHKSLTLGSLISFITFSNMLFAPLNSLVNGLLKMKEVGISADRIIEYLDKTTKKELQDKSILAEPVNTISLTNICLYKENYKIKDNINLNISGPGLYIITGKNGTGKSTLAKTLSKVYTQYDGEILFNDINLRNISEEYIRNNILYIDNTDSIFIGTLEYNLFIENSNYRLLNQYSYLLCGSINKKLHAGIHSQIDESLKVVLSNGEKQIIYLLRALLRNPKVLIIDEPEQSLDSSTREKLKELLVQKSKSIIIIIITHSNDFISLSDNITVL